MGISFKRSHARTAALRAPNPAAGHRWLMALPETTGHSWASLGQSLVGSLLLSLGSWWHKFLFVFSKGQIPQSCVSSGGSMVGLMVTFSKRDYAIPWSIASRAPAPTATKWRCSVVSDPLWPDGLQHPRLLCPLDFPGRNTGVCCHFLLHLLPQETLKHSSGSGSVGSLGPGAHKVCLSTPSVSGGYGVWF